MKHYVSSDFDGSTVVFVVWDPNEVSFGCSGVAEESAILAAGFKLGEMAGDNTSSAFCTEDAEMGEVGSTIEP